MTRVERSAGFVLYRTSSSGGRLYLLLDYGRHWDYAKGHVEKGEDDLSAAIRELREETGLGPPRVVEGFCREIEYTFRSSRHGLVRKQVVFFLAETNESKVVLSEEHVGHAFLSYEEALDRLTFAGARDVLKAAETHLAG